MRRALFQGAAFSVLVAALGTGCGSLPSISGAGSQAQSPQPAIAVDQSTPQAALETLFRFQDRQILREHERELEFGKTPPLFPDVMAVHALFGGRMKPYADRMSAPDPEKPVLETYARTIQQVIHLSSNRVLATVAVINTTPAPAGADLVVHGSFLYRGDAARKQLYRYTLEAAGRGWEITNVESYVKQPGQADGVSDFEEVPEADAKSPAEPLMFLRVKPLF